MYATEILSDERSLVLRLIEGDEDAFCELYAAYTVSYTHLRAHET